MNICFRSRMESDTVSSINIIRELLWFVNLEDVELPKMDKPPGANCRYSAPNGNPGIYRWNY